MHQLFKRLCCISLVTMLLLTAAQARETSFVMRDVYDAIAYLLPLSVRGDVPASPWDEELITAKLDTLKQAAAELRDHTQADDAEMVLLARAFDQLINDSIIAFGEHWPDYAFYSMLELTGYCVSCHSRLPAESQNLFGERLMARMNLENISTETRAQLYVATRQFDAALGQLAKQLSDLSMDPIEAEYRGLLVVYLRTGLSVSNNYQRVSQFLQSYRARPDLPYFLKRRLDHWLVQLGKHEKLLDGSAELEDAMALFDDASKLSLAPGNRVRAVDDFVAARLLREYLNSEPEIAPALRAEIYYKLAIIALRTAEADPAVPEMEILLVSSIKADPKGPFARDAYALLEEYGYVHEEHLARQLSSSVMIDMRELREMVNAGSP